MHVDTFESFETGGCSGVVEIQTAARSGKFKD